MKRLDRGTKLINEMKARVPAEGLRVKEMLVMRGNGFMNGADQDDVIVSMSWDVIVALIQVQDWRRSKLCVRANCWIEKSISLLAVLPNHRQTSCIMTEVDGMASMRGKTETARFVF